MRCRKRWRFESFFRFFFRFDALVFSRCSSVRPDAGWLRRLTSDASR